MRGLPIRACIQVFGDTYKDARMAVHFLLLINIVKFSNRLPTENLVKFAIMKKVLVTFMAVFICSLSTLGQTSVATIGRAVTQCNDFAFAKNLLTGDGLIYDEAKSNKSFARFYKPAQYADKALFVEVYKSKGGSKIEKCVVTFYNVNYLSDLSKVGYKYCNPEDLSIEPFQMLYESDKYAMGLNSNKKGWLVATFFRYDQEVEFEHLLEK